MGTGVPTDVTIDVGLSEPPYPPDLSAAWTLRTAGVRVTGIATADLVDRRVRVRAARGLYAHLRYFFTLGAALRSFDGAALAPGVELDFVTGEGPAGIAPAPPVGLRARVVPALAAPCTASGCHDARTRAEQLDLSSAAGLLDAVARTARDLPAATLVVRGSHAESYLVWKALGLGHTVGHRTPTLPHDAARALADWIEQGALDN
jgi:hypothetical protein